jgi:hypothetical protein
MGSAPSPHIAMLPPILFSNQWHRKYRERNAGLHTLQPVDTARGEWRQM